MTQSLSEVAAALRTAGAMVARVRTALPEAALARDAFGADAGGGLGAVGGRLHALWQAAVDARVAEASELAGELEDAAQTVAVTAARYSDIEQRTRQGWMEAS